MEVDLRTLTVDQLLKERPDLFKALQTEVLQSETFKKERQRILAIVKSVHHNFSRGIEKELIVPIEMKAISEGWSLDRLEIEVNALLLGSAGATNKLSHLDRAKLYQNKYGCSITDALRATAGQIKS